MRPFLSTQDSIYRRPIILADASELSIQQYGVDLVASFEIEEAQRILRDAGIRSRIRGPVGFSDDPYRLEGLVDSRWVTIEEIVEREVHQFVILDFVRKHGV